MSFAQEDTSNNTAYKTSKPFRVFDFDYNYYVSKNDEIVVVKFIRDNCVVQRFSTAVPELIKENRYVDFFPSGYRIEEAKEIDGKYYFFYTMINKDKKCQDLFAQEIDFDKAEFINKPKLILSSEGKPENNRKSEYLHKNRISITSCFEFIQPKDKSNLLIKYVTFSKEKKEGSIKINLFDKNVTGLYSKTLPFDFDYKTNFILSSLVDKNGNFYFASKVNLNNDGKKEDTYNIYLNTVNLNSDDVKRVELNLENKFINELWIRDFDNGIVCGGYTCDVDNSKKGIFSLGKSDFNNSNGIALFKVNFNDEKTESYHLKIPETILHFYRNRQDDNYLNNLYLHDFEILSNNEIVIIGEQFAIEGYRENTFGVYRDILVCKLGINGDLNFIKRLPKIQSSANESQPFSFKTFYTDDGIFIPFIDNVKNLDNEKPKIEYASGDLILSRISLKDGSIHRKFILNISYSGNNLNKFSVNRFYKSKLNSFCFDAYKKEKEDLIISVDFQ